MNFGPEEVSIPSDEEDIPFSEITPGTLMANCFPSWTRGASSDLAQTPSMQWNEILLFGVGLTDRFYDHISTVGAIKNKFIQVVTNRYFSAIQ